MSRGVVGATWLVCLTGAAMAAWIVPGCNKLGDAVDDGGTVDDTGTVDSTTDTSSSSSGSSSGVSGSGSSGSGSGGGSSGGNVCEGGLSCTVPTTSVPVNLVPAYVPVHPMPSACTISDIVQYDLDCMNPFSPMCTTWFVDGGGFGSCGACANPGTFTDAGLFVPNSTGASMVDGTGGQWPNLPGCVEIFDKNAGCASVLWSFLECAYASCACCASMGGDMPACITVTETGACKNAFAAVTSACMADYAPGGSLDSPNCHGLTGVGDRAAVTSIICAGGPPIEAGVDASEGGMDGGVEAGDEGGD